MRTRRRPADPGTREFKAYATLEQHGLSYELAAPPGGLMAELEVARAYPGLQCIIGHAGSPSERNPEYFERWRAELCALAELPNVACKISGFGMFDHDWTIESVRPFVLHCVEQFGVDRCMFGTNWPVDVLYGSYLRQVDAWRLILARAGVGRSDQEKMLHGNAIRIYQL